MDSNPIGIIGAGGHAKVVAATLLDMGVKVECLYDDDEMKWGGEVLGMGVHGPVQMLMERGTAQAIVAIGDNRSRKNISDEIKGVEWLTAVHPDVYVHSSVNVGCGTVVFAGAVIQPDVIIGDHCIINTGTVIDHDCVIGSYAHIAPGVRLAGNVRIGLGTLVGIGSIVSPGISIGDNSVIGAGSVVVSDIPSNVTAYGVPASVR